MSLREDPPTALSIKKGEYVYIDSSKKRVKCEGISSIKITCIRIIWVCYLMYILYIQSCMMCYIINSRVKSRNCKRKGRIIYRQRGLYKFLLRFYKRSSYIPQCRAIKFNSIVRSKNIIRFTAVKWLVIIDSPTLSLSLYWQSRMIIIWRV